MLQEFQTIFSSICQNGILPDDVAKVIPRSVTTTNPDLRYMVSEDADILIDTKARKCPNVNFMI